MRLSSSAAAAAAAAQQDGGRRLRKGSPPKTPRQLAATNPDEPVQEATVEEQLLAALLSANEDLTGALRVYEELERLKIEKETQQRSKKETRMGPRVRHDHIVEHPLRSFP